MTKSKSETDIEILSGASTGNNEISEVRTRHSESVHSLDCNCELCRRTHFGKENENEVKEELNWYESPNKEGAN